MKEGGGNDGEKPNAQLAWKNNPAFKNEGNKDRVK